MKGKTKTYMLLAGVIAIWGAIGYKIMATINPDTPEINEQDMAVSFNPKTTTKVDTFSIQPTERDPFLGTLYVKKNPRSKTKKVKPKETLAWPPIIYHGAITKQQSKAQVFVISINGKQNLMRVGQEMNGVKLVKANAKEIRVVYKREKKTITKI